MHNGEQPKEMDVSRMSQDVFNQAQSSYTHTRSQEHQAPCLLTLWQVLQTS